MKTDEFFQKLENSIEKIYSLLLEIQKGIPDKGLGDQKITDLQKGLIKKGKIYIPLTSVNHKILFNGIEEINIDLYIQLFNKLFTKPNDEFAQFALRTVLELSFERIQILFDDKISEDQKNRFKVVLLLADYAMVANKYEHKSNFIKLLQEYKNLFKPKSFDFYMDLISNLQNLSPIDKNDKIVAARARLASVQGELIPKTTPSPIIREINITSFTDISSHLLHGNMLLLSNVFKKFNTSEQKLRVYWTLILSGVNVINIAGKTLNNSKIDKSIKEINDEFVEISKIVENNWDKLND